MKLTVFGAAALLAAVSCGPGETPPGQPPLRTVTAGTIGDVRSVFNADADGLRVILLLSPT